jgi:CheY-like chemotaxis protein
MPRSVSGPGRRQEKRVIRPDCYYYMRHPIEKGVTHTCLIRVHENTVQTGIKTLVQVKTAIRALTESGQTVHYGPLLPCDDEASHCMYQLAVLVAEAPQERPARERPLVLVVDDDKQLVELLKDMLGSRKIETATAANGLEGLEVAQERRPDLVILDVMMPGLDGYKTCAIMKDNPHLKPIPVLMFTAGDTAKFNEKAFRAGAAFCLGKPFEAARFLGIVEMLLSQTQVLPARGEPERRVRAFRRYAARYRVTARATGGTAQRREVGGFTGNVSAGGLLLTLPERFPLMTPLQVRIETSAGSVALNTTVVWCGSSARRPGDIPHGVRILEVRTPEDAARWTHVLQGLAATVPPLPEPKI